MKLNPYQEKWLQMLESDKWKNKQGRGQLKSDTKYCCLGVGAIACGVNSTRIKGITLNQYPHVLRKLCLHDDAGKIIGKRIQGCSLLVEANDNLVSFKEIANFIRKNPETVFKN